MKKVLFIITFLLSNLVNAQDKIDVNLNWTNGPKSFIESHLVITVETIETFDDIDIEMELWMPMMGHGSYPVAIKKRNCSDKKCVFEVNDIYFTMPGLWEVNLNIIKDEVIIKELNLEYSL